MKEAEPRVREREEILMIMFELLDSTIPEAGEATIGFLDSWILPFLCKLL